MTKKGNTNRKVSSIQPFLSQNSRLTNQLKHLHKRSFKSLKCVFIYLLCIILIIEFSLALSEQECENWIRGLRYMVNDTLSTTYPLEMERWLRKEFYHIENCREM